MSTTPSSSIDAKVDDFTFESPTVVYDYDTFEPYRALVSEFAKDVRHMTVAIDIHTERMRGGSFNRTVTIFCSSRTERRTYVANATI
jgi:hypothetical protein